jgi:hypothetical protein
MMLEYFKTLAMICGGTLLVCVTFWIIDKPG